MEQILQNNREEVLDTQEPAEGKKPFFDIEEQEKAAAEFMRQQQDGQFENFKKNPNKLPTREEVVAGIKRELEFDDLKKRLEYEVSVEGAPSEEQVLGVIGRFTQGRERFGDVKKEYDSENRLVSLEVKTTDPNENEGDPVGFLYVRKGIHSSSSSLTSEIHYINYFPGGEDAGGGGPLFELADNDWRFIKPANLH